MKLTETQRGILTVFGGFTVHLVIGAVFMWGTLNVYITSYFRQLNDEGLSLSIGGAIFPVMMLSVATGMPFGMKAIQLFGSARYYVMAASIICSLLVFVSSYSEKFWQYVLIYGIVFGFFSGSIYFIPIYMGYLFFPKKKGFVSGTILAGYGLSSLVFGMTFFSFVNPNSLQQQINPDGYSYFEGDSIEVARNVPGVIRKMSLIYVIVAVFGSMFIMYHPNQIGEEERRLKKELQKTQQKENNLKMQLENLPNVNLTLRQPNIQGDQENRRQSLIQEKIEAVKKNLELVEYEEIIIERQIELQQQEDKVQPYLPYDQIDAPKENNKNEAITTSSQASEDANSQKNLKKNKSQIIDPESNSLKSQDDEIGQNRKTHKNEYIEQLEIEVRQIQKSVQIIRDEIIERNIQLEDKQKQIEEYNKIGAPTVKEAFKQPQYYMSLLLAILAVGFPILINGNYKSVAKDYGYLDDTFQTIVGALVSIANGLSRPMWATLLDRYTFKQILTIVLFIQIICTFTLQFTDVDQVFFAIWIFIINTTFGGVLAMWPVFSAQLNGVKIGSKIYGTYWYAFGISNFIQFFFVYFLKPQIGFNNIFYIYTGVSCLAVITLQVYKFKIEWSKYYLKQENFKLLKQNEEIYQHTRPTQETFQQNEDKQKKKFES